MNANIFKKMILYAVYLATLSKAKVMTRSSNERLKVFLTRVGVSQNDENISKKLSNFLKYFEKSPIDVYLVKDEKDSGFDETNKSRDRYK